MGFYLSQFPQDHSEYQTEYVVKTQLKTIKSSSPSLSNYDYEEKTVELEFPLSLLDKVGLNHMVTALHWLF